MRNVVCLFFVRMLVIHRANERHTRIISHARVSIDVWNKRIAQLQRTADATARGYIQYYITYGQAYSSSKGATLYTQGNNPIDASSGIAPTVKVTWGYWTPATNSFSASSGTVLAVQVTIARTKSAGNALPLFWGGMFGLCRPTCIRPPSPPDLGVGRAASVSPPRPAFIFPECPVDLPQRAATQPLTPRPIK